MSRILRRAGFTLIELLVAMAIVALILTALVGTLQGTVKAHDDIEIEMAAVRDGPRILDMIERDLRSIHLFNLKDGNVLAGKSEHPSGLRGDRIDFVCEKDSARRLPDPSVKDDSGPGVASHVNEVGYRLRPSSFSQDFLELWRREDVFVDDQPFEGGVYEKVHDRITAFQITYIASLNDKSDELDDWDMTEKKKLPAAIHVHLELQATPELVGGFIENKQDERKKYFYDRLIAFTDDDQIALNVRPYLPTKITGRGAGGGGAGTLNGDMTGQLNAGLNGAGPGSPLAGMGPGAGQNGQNGDGKDKSDLKDHKTLSGMEDELRNRQHFNPFDPNAAGNSPFIIGGGGGNLSPSDQQKIEQFMDDYRNRYGQGGSFGGGSSGGSSRGGSSRH